MMHLEKALMYYRKAHVILTEAEKDLQIQCHHKAISAFYFAIEAIANVLLAIKKQKTRGFSGRLAVIRQILGAELSSEIKNIHEMREKADHREQILSKEIAIKIAEKARNIFMKIKIEAEKELEKQGVKIKDHEGNFSALG